MNLPAPCSWPGDPVEEHDNPADHFLDVVIASEKAKEKQEDGVKEEEEEEKAGLEGKTVDLVGHYAVSREYTTLRSSINPVLENLERKEKEAGLLGQKLGRERVSYATNFIWQVQTVMWLWCSVTLSLPPCVYSGWLWVCALL